MKLNSDKEILAEYKVLILYIINKLETPVLESKLTDLVLTTTDINYFYYGQLLHDLINCKYVECENKDNLNYYSLTELGKQTLDLTKNLVPGITKLSVDSKFRPELESYKNEQSIVSEYIPRSENTFDIKCQIIDNEDTLLEIKVFAGSKNQAQKIANNWKQNATDIYPKIIDLLIGKE